MKRRVRRLAVVVAALVHGAAGSARADEPAKTPDAPKAAESPKAQEAAKIASPDGVAVTFMSNAPDTVVYLAHGDVSERADPDPFERLGVAPMTVKLAPGTYTVETEGRTQSNGHQRLVVEHDAPLTVRIHAGDSNLRTVGGILAALGIAGVVLGVVAIVSITKDDSGYDRWGIGLPLVIGGVVSSSAGFAMIAGGSTDVQAPHLPPGGPPRPAGFVPRLVVSF